MSTKERILEVRLVFVAPKTNDNQKRENQRNPLTEGIKANCEGRGVVGETPTKTPTDVVENIATQDRLEVCHENGGPTVTTIPVKKPRRGS